MTFTLQLVAETAYAKPESWLDQPLANATFVVFDVETTGLTAKQARVLEIGAIKFRNGAILERRNWLVKPDVPIPMEVQNIHGITPAHVSNAPPFSSIFPEFSAFTSNSILLAHNARFDHAFIAEEITRNQLPFPGTPILDTIPMFKSWHPELRSYALQYLTECLHPDHHSHTLADDSLPEGTLRTNRFHSALYDCEFLSLLVMGGFQKMPPDATVKALTQIAGGYYFFEHQRRKKMPRKDPACKP